MSCREALHFVNKILTEPNLYGAVHIANFEGILGFSAPSILGPQKQNWELGEGNHDGEWNFCQWKETDTALFLQVSRIRKVRKISLWSKLVDYGLKWYDHKQRTLKQCRNKTNRSKSTNCKLKTMTLWTRWSKYHVFPKRFARMIDWTEKPKIPLMLAKRTAQYNEFGSINGRTKLKGDQFPNHAIYKSWMDSSFLKPDFYHPSTCSWVTATKFWEFATI